MAAHLKNKQEVSCDLWQTNSFLNVSFLTSAAGPIDFKESVNNLFLWWLNSKQ